MTGVRAEFLRSTDLAQRAAQVVPNGVFGHQRSFVFAGGVSRPIPADYPHFVSRAEGCRFWDVDGNEFIDYLCGYGPMIVGYRNERVDRAAEAERAEGTCYNFPSVRYVELAERLVALEPVARWASFALNGTDALMLGLVVARAATGRSALVVADGAFHGNQPWAREGPGWSPGDRSQTRTVPWGDADALGELLASEPVAAVVLCPYEQLVGADNRMPPPGYWDAVRHHCTAHGCLLMIDDIRSGFRLDAAGSCAHFGIQPDLICLSKAMANGYPVAALVGTDAVRPAAEEVFVSGTFWGFGPALAAALATLDLLGEPGTRERLSALGRRLTDGLSALAQVHDLQLVVTGPAALPHVRFDGDVDYELAARFATLMAVQGSFVHPTHNWFLSLAHQPDDIDRTLEHAEVALAGVTRNR